MPATLGQRPQRPVEQRPGLPSQPNGAGRGTDGRLAGVTATLRPASSAQRLDALQGIHARSDRDQAAKAAPGDRGLAPAAPAGEPPPLAPVRAGLLRARPGGALAERPDSQGAPEHSAARWEPACAADAARRSRNRILAALPDDRLARLAPHLEPVVLTPKMVLERPGEITEHAYLPSAGVISMVVVGADGQRVEASLFGREGMSGLSVALGSDRPFHEVVVQMPGHGHRIEAGVLRDALRAEAGLREAVLRYAQAVLAQVSHAALANARHSIEARLARWLLMCHDRVDGDALDVTHELLSVVLGVRRAGVTVAVHMLEGRGLIRATRGRIRILDRAGLEAAAHGIYGAPEADHAGLAGEEPGEG